MLKAPGTRWWSQEEGLALFLVLDRLLPDWPDRAFSANPALGIDLRQNLRDLTNSALRIEERGLKVHDLEWSPRIGITQAADRPWRCSIVGHAAVSGKGARPKQSTSDLVPTKREPRTEVVSAAR